MTDNQDEFDDIIKYGGLDDHFIKYEKSIITLGDLYEGMALMSSVQADLYHYLYKVVRAIQEKNKTNDKNVFDIPQLTPTQALYLSQMFQIAALFLEEPGIEDENGS